MVKFEVVDSATIYKSGTVKVEHRKVLSIPEQKRERPPRGKQDERNCNNSNLIIFVIK